MCKLCQSCCETIYWHAIEKRFCWDESIALYEEPKPSHEEKNNNAFDNLAFYDSVAIIANRPIFTIEPLSNKPKPIVQQPRKKIRWFEDEVKQNTENESKNNAAASASSSALKLDTPAIQEGTEQPPADVVDAAQAKEGEAKGKQEQHDDVMDAPVEKVALRRKSLTQRRMSKGLTLIIDRAELPVIRQSSVPKFYLDTPEAHQLESSIARTPSVALTTPIKPKHHEFTFDLRSVVQIETEKSQNKVADRVERVESKRVTQIRNKLKPLKIKRQTSSGSPNMVTHM